MLKVALPQKIWPLLLALLIISGCSSATYQTIEPKIQIPTSSRLVDAIPNTFPELNNEEKTADWGKEMQIASHFAKELDLYRAITAYKRAKILSSTHFPLRQGEIEYKIVLCYFLAKRYEDAIEYFEKSELRNIFPDFPGYQSLLILLSESYIQTKAEPKAEHVKQLLVQSKAPFAHRLALYHALHKADLTQLKELCNRLGESSSFDIPSYPSKESTQKSLIHFLSSYETQKKSRATAQWLSAIIPGSGYLYVGQKKSALTSFLLNSLFIAASYRLFERGHTALGIITTSFELGWYVGGIYGSGLAAKKYNETLYEALGKQALYQTKAHPLFMINCGF